MLLDINLSEPNTNQVDGEDVLKELKYRKPESQVVVLSSQRNQTEGDELVSLGANAFITKEQLIHRVSPYYLNQVFDSFLRH